MDIEASIYDDVVHFFRSEVIQRFTKAYSKEIKKCNRSSITYALTYVGTSVSSVVGLRTCTAGSGTGEGPIQKLTEV